MRQAVQVLSLTTRMAAANKSLRLALVGSVTVAIALGGVTFHLELREHGSVRRMAKAYERQARAERDRVDNAPVFLARPSAEIHTRGEPPSARHQDPNKYVD
jgi:hypothetical protein